jgi:hypothetical protein
VVCPIYTCVQYARTPFGMSQRRKGVHQCVPHNSLLGLEDLQLTREESVYWFTKTRWESGALDALASLGDVLILSRAQQEHGRASYTSVTDNNLGLEQLGKAISRELTTAACCESPFSVEYWWLLFPLFNAGERKLNHLLTMLVTFSNGAV